MSPRNLSIAQRLFSLGSDNLATERETRFVRSMRQMPGVQRIGLGSLIKLKEVFQGAASTDPYYVSPTYYGLTGRRGLWSYAQDENTALIFCLHPDLQDTLLVFPPFGERPEEILPDFLSRIRDHGLTVNLSRVPANEEDLPHIAKTITGYSVTEGDEPILDWTFPVHTISCEKHERRSGGEYQPLRQAINAIKRIPKNERSVRPINFSDDGDQLILRRLAHQWEKASAVRQQHRQNYDQTPLEADYFVYLAQKIAPLRPLNLQGLFLNIRGQDVGFAIWEPPVGGAGNTANLFASQAIDCGIPHVSTYMVHKALKRVAQQGGDNLCLGGSESQGMDRWKRKFVPTLSTALKTVSLTPEIGGADETASGSAEKNRALLDQITQSNGKMMTPVINMPAIKAQGHLPPPVSQGATKTANGQAPLFAHHETFGRPRAPTPAA